LTLGTFLLKYDIELDSSFVRTVIIGFDELLLLELGLPTADILCIINVLVFCLQVIARCHAIGLFSGSK